MLPSSSTTTAAASDGHAPLRVALLAGARFPIREPFVGGLEAHTWLLATGLQARGHHVTVFAGAGSDPDLDVRPYAGGRPELSSDARADVSLGPEAAMWDHHAYQSTMVDLARDPGRYDVVHNNSVHHLPLALSPVVPLPQVTTLHTPPTAWMELAIKAAAEPLPVRFCAVSAHTAAAWRCSIPHAEVIANAIDLDRWVPGPGGTDAVWSGRIVPEKGLHLAIDAARAAGRRLRFAGPRLDEAYWTEEVAPRLDDDVEWVGHLCQDELRDLVGRSAVAVVSPCWDEPFGLVALEAIACGTPVAAIGRGGLAEIVDERSGVLADHGGADLAAAIRRAATLDRAAVRRRAEQVGSSARMIDEYVALYRSCLS